MNGGDAGVTTTWKQLQWRQCTYNKIQIHNWHGHMRVLLYTYVVSLGHAHALKIDISSPEI
jgi:hypothetical protein